MPPPYVSLETAFLIPNETVNPSSSFAAFDDNHEDYITAKIVNTSNNEDDETLFEKHKKKIQ